MGLSSLFLRPLSEAAQGSAYLLRSRPGLGVLAHPPVVDEADRDGVQEVELFAASPFGDHEPSVLELFQVLHHAEARH